MRIIGNKQDNRQYAVGDDNILHWIFGQPGEDSAILMQLHNAGVVDKTKVEWKDNLNGFTIGNPWGA